MRVDEITISVHGLSLAVKTWGEPGDPPLLALHGWQDNAATFDRLAPALPGYFWVAPDLPGHGRSGHRGQGADYSLWGYGPDVMALANALDLERFTLVGHSMGGGIASLLAALSPERVDKLVLLDVLGTLTTPADEALEQMRKALRQRGKPLRRAGVYPSRDEAVMARARVGVEREAAVLLGERGIVPADGGYSWGHDQRLSQKSLLSMTDEQLAPFLSAITCPVLAITSKEAVIREEAIRSRASLVRDIRVEHLPGGHHQHLDGDVEAVAGAIGVFLARS